MNVETLMPLGLVLAVWLGSLLGTRWLIGYLTSQQIMDQPNERSSHEVPTPRGGGIAVTSTILIGLALLIPDFAGPWRDGVFAVMVGMALLAMISFLDDILTLRARSRFAIQAIAVTIGLWFLPSYGGVFSAWLPHPIDLALTGIAWLWFLNLFNFMDGIDGISGVEAISIAAGVLLLVNLGAVPLELLFPPLIIVAAMFGFLRWNWHPARIFLGDVGSVPVGYLLGWLLITTGSLGETGGALWIAALILPLYYLVDATFTLLKRLSRGENIFEAHRQHFYQKAVINGHSHGMVCSVIAGANLMLVGCAGLAILHSPILALVIAVVVVGALMYWLGFAKPIATGSAEDS